MFQTQDLQSQFQQKSKKLEFKKLRGLLENILYKNSLREEVTTGTGKQTQVPAQKLKNQVRDIYTKLNNVIKTSTSKTDSFQAGNIKNFLENWKRITSVKYILDIVKHGLKLDFLSVAPHREPFRVTYNTKENDIISQEINKLLKKKSYYRQLLKKGIFSPQYFYELKKMGVAG